MIVPVLFLAQVLNTTVSHQPYEVLKSITGAGLPKVGLYEIVTCNVTSTPASVAEGRILQQMTTRVGSISPTTVRSLLARSKRKTKRYRALRTLEYLGMAAALFATGGGSSGATATKAAFSGLVAHSFSSKIADSMRDQEDGAERVISTLLDASRLVDIPGKACIVRMSFGEYRQGFPPYTISWQP